MGIRGAVLLALVVASCGIDDRLVPCGDKLCPIGSVCTPGGCTTQEAAEACIGKADGDPCMTMSIAMGTCSGGACYAVVCGNRVIDRNEVCDDGNQISGDGCSADCRSLETCGNAIADTAAGEVCDSGVAGLSGDGCTSTCTSELDLWRDRTPGPPDRRRDHAMAYDSVRGVSVMFGGMGGVPFADTWEWNGSIWQPRFPLTSPSARSMHVMVFDTNRQKTVLFGGFDGTTTLGDTWEYDGTNWTQRTFATAPSARTNAAMAYDPVRQRIVLFGGRDAANALLADTWEFDGTTWSQPTLTGSSPSPRESAAAAYDAFSSKVLLGGGFTGSAPLGDAWLFDGSAWTSAPAPLPSPRRESVMVSDVQNQLVYLLGGIGDTGVLGDTRIWNGSSWSSTANMPGGRYAHAATYDGVHIVLFAGRDGQATLGDTAIFEVSQWGPPAAQLGRISAAAAYDARRGNIVMFGGLNNGQPLRDHWEWNGTNWLARFVPLPPAGPTRRFLHAMTYDEARDRVVMFGGIDLGQSAKDETWLFDGQTWSLAQPAQKPPARLSPGMTYDSARKVVVVFGGEASSTNFNDTWEWNGTTWTQVQTSSAPIGRGAVAIAYDEARKRVVMFGGFNDTTKVLYGDTWEYDGTTWKDVTPAVSPPARFGHSLVYDPVRQRVELFGGNAPSAFYDDTWEWDGTSWTQQMPLVSPSRRHGQVMAYDAIHRQMVMFGGETTATVNAGDTWVRSFESGAPTAERCIFATEDSDGDGLIGCADPDCYGRCNPLCRPGMTCDPADPHCGDGTCGPVEDSALCPSDCP